MGAILAKRKRTAADAWIESLDPLNGLSIAQARSTYNAARRHGSPLLQKMYSEIEESDPVLMTCVERRQSALAGLGWRTVANASAPDQGLAEEQRTALEEFANGIEDLDNAIEHLGLGFFRGFSVCQPIWGGGGVRHIELLDSWNFLRGENGELLWNPECSMVPARCIAITPEARAVVFRRRRAIDWPALNIYIRKYIGERDWGRFLERYGIPPVDVVMAPNTTNAQRDDYLESAEAARDGRPAAWPAGSQISRAEGSRGQDPFSAFLEHQEKLVVLMATGGTLTSLAQADTGSLAGGAQMDVWTQIVARDGVAISTVLNRALFGPFLREKFPGRPVSARLELGHEDEPTAEEAAELAGKLRVAGYRVNQAQLEEATGYKLEREQDAPQMGVPGPGGLWNARVPDGMPLQSVATPLQNARAPLGGTSVPPGAPNASTGILEPSAPDEGAVRLARALQRDLRPAGKIIAEALRTHDWKAARKQLAGALKECGTESAEVLEDEMQEAGEKGLGKLGGRDGLERAAVGNSECRAKDPAHCRTHGTPREPETKRQHDRFGSTDTETLLAQPERNAERGKAAMDEVQRNHRTVEKAVYREETGWIQMEWGDPGNPHDNWRGGHGISHIQAKHEKDLKYLPEVLAKGDIYKHEEEEKLYVVHESRFAVVASLKKGGKKTITEFEPNNPDKIALIKQNPRAHKPGEN